MRFSRHRVLGGGLVSFSAATVALAAVALVGSARGQTLIPIPPGGIGAVTGTGGTGGIFGSAGSTGAGACALRSSATPPASDGHGLVYDAARDVTLLLTATPGGGPAVLYEMSFAGGGSPVWSRVTPFGPVPSSRFAPGFVYDHKTGRAVLFGGNGAAPGPTQPRDVWEWDGCRWTNRTPAWAPTAGWPAASGVWPSSRWAPAMTYDWASERVVLTTGIQNPTFQWETDPADATVFEWDSSAGTFVVRPPAGQPPTDRGGSLVIGDRNRKLVYLVTGLQENDSPSGGWDTSLYVWNGATGTWTKRTASPAPSAREFASIYHDLVADRIVVMGGVWYDWFWTPEYWHYSPDANAFSLLVTDPAAYTPTSGFAEMNRFWSPVAYDERHDVAVRYGGRRAEQTHCFANCALELLGDTTIITSGGVPVDFVVPPFGPDAGAPPGGGTIAPPLANIAFNQNCPSGFPSPLESDDGWGGGALPCDVVDGQLSYDTWARGLAFTGGHQSAAGGVPYLEPAGPRHAVIDFGVPKTFQKVTMWWHGIEHTPDTATLEVWNGSAWVAIAPFSRAYGTRHEEGTNSGYSDSDDYTFAPVTGSKFRYTFDNSGHNVIGTWNVHGWLYEIQVWSAGSGEPCLTARECASRFCVDGVCCASACGGGDPGDCQACAIAAGGAVQGTCGPVAVTQICRAAAGSCDVAELCDGTGVACPADALAPAGVVCASGGCDETHCAGSSPACDGITVDVCPPLPAPNPIGTPCAEGLECESGICTDGVCCATACGDGAPDDCQACSVAAGGSENGTCTPRGIGVTCRERVDACDFTESCDGVFFQCPVDAGVLACVPVPVPACAPPACGATSTTTVSIDDGDIDVTFIGPVGAGTIAAVQSDPGAPSGPLPTGYKIMSGSSTFYYFDLESTASPPASSMEVCIHYQQGTLKEGCNYAGPPAPTPNELLIRLVHDDGLHVCGGSPFCTITMTRDPCGNRICGNTSSLSPFAILVPVDDAGPVVGDVPGTIVAYATSTAGAAVTYATPTATDGFDGPVPVTCTPASVAVFPPGKTTVKCSAVDGSGNPGQGSFTVWVQYQAPADGTFFLKPIRPDGSSRFKIGRAVPVKFQLAGASAGIANLAARLTVTRISDAVRGTVDCDGDEDGEDTDMLFKYRKNKGLYGYRWKTRGETQGTYRLRADLGDDVTHEIDVSLKAPR